MKALATFVRLVSKLLAGQEDFLEAFIEDIGIYSNTVEENFEHYKTVF